LQYSKILLTRPSTVQGNRIDPFPQPALGLASIAAALEKKIKVLTILDGNFCKDYLNDLSQIVHAECPGIVGFSVFTSFAGKVMEGARLVKSIDPKILVIVGGPHASALGEKTLAKCSAVDIAVCGEGEAPMLEIVEGKSLSEIAGIVFRDDNGEIVMNAPKIVKDLGTLPFPAYHLLPYFPNGYKPHPPRGAFRRVWTSLIRSRGCPYNCAYCCRDASFGRTYRFNSTDYTINLIRHLHDKYNISEITFYDDVFTCDRKETVNLLKAMVPETLGFDLIWDCETRVDLVDPELLLAMKKAGCRIIAFGVEHGVWIKEIKGGQATLEQAEKAIRWAHQAGIKTIGYFMIGLPNETPETIGETINFAKKLNVNWAQFSIMIPIPGSQLYTQAVEENPSLDEEWDKLVYESLGKMDIPLNFTKSLSVDDLKSWRRRAYKEFYLRRQFISKQLLSVRNFKDLSTNAAGFKMFLRTVSGS
jgi:anaerobic magnesium-protoporphyrin IX monomethyl ester cyclase